MRYKKIFLFGDSWTEGQGIGTGELVNSSEPDIANKVSKYRKQNHPITKRLIDWFDYEVENLALQGNSNSNSLNLLKKMIEGGEIIEGDIVIIGFTSLIRDYHSFIPPDFQNHRFGWTISNIIQEINERSEKGQIDSILNQYSKNYILNIFDEEYYKYVGFNMVYFLQHYFSALNINYYFWNTFETIVTNDYKHSKYIDKTKYINFGTNYYDELKKEEELLIKDNLVKRLLGGKKLEYTFWERNFIKPKNIVHPNYYGYEYIAKQILDFIKKNPQ